MSEQTDNDARDVVSNIFTGAANTASAIAVGIPDPTLKAALNIGAAIASIVGSLVGSIGVDATKKLVEELQRRRNAGTISDVMLSEDDEYIRESVKKLFIDKT